MSAETAIDISTTRKVRRGPAEKLREALSSLAGGKAQILTHSERSWASITFSGARHSIELAFEGIVAAKAGEEFIALLPDVRLVVKAELLLLQDA